MEDSTNLIWIGAVLLIVGSVLFAISYSTVQYMQTGSNYGEGFLGACQSYSYFPGCPQYWQEYEQAVTTNYFGGFVAIFGGIMLTVGLIRASSGSIQSLSSEGKLVSPAKFCRECGSKILRDSKFCKECGAKTA